MLPDFLVKDSVSGWIGDHQTRQCIFVLLTLQIKGIKGLLYFVVYLLIHSWRTYGQHFIYPVPKLNLITNLACKFHFFFWQRHVVITKFSTQLNGLHS